MGLYRTDYIVYGWKLPLLMKDKDGNTINFRDNKFLPYIEGYKDIKYIIVRDFNKKHLVFGKLMGINSDGWNYENLNMSHINSEEVKNKYREVFDVESEISEPYLFIFSHWN